MNQASLCDIGVTDSGPKVFFVGCHSYAISGLFFKSDLHTGHPLFRRIRSAGVAVNECPSGQDPVKCGVAHIADIFRSDVIALVVPFVRKLRLAGKQRVSFAFAERAGR